MLPMIYMSLIDDEDLPAFRELYEKYKHKVYHTAFDILGTEALAEACVSETFFKVAIYFQTVKALKPNHQLKYIIVCGKNTALNMAQKERPNIVINKFDNEVYFSDDSYNKYDEVCWKECIAKMNKTDIEILYLRLVMELDYKQISNMLSISSEAARTRAYNAKNNLRKLILNEEA